MHGGSASGWKKQKMKKKTWGMRETCRCKCGRGVWDWEGSRQGAAKELCKAGVGMFRVRVEDRCGTGSGRVLRSRAGVVCKYE